MSVLVKELVAIVLITTAMDLLLPNGKLNNFVRMVMGLFIIVSILSPILNILNNNELLSAFNISENEYLTHDVLDEGNKLLEENKSEILQNYEENLAKQMKALILLKDVDKCEVKVSAFLDERLGAVAGINKVEIKISNKDVYEERIKEVICMYYSLQEDIVEVSEYE